MALEGLVYSYFPLGLILVVVFLHVGMDIINNDSRNRQLIQIILVIHEKNGGKKYCNVLLGQQNEYYYMEDNKNKRQAEGLEAKRREMARNKAMIIDKQSESKENIWEKGQQSTQHLWGLHSRQRQIEQKQEIIPNKVLKHSENSSKSWNYASTNHKITTKILTSNTYYPPSCSGYDMAYCKYNESIYIYGGISCSSSLSDGIKQYFYRFIDGKWSEVKTESAYNPTPRYGHTLTAYQKELILFGGVSQYKEKLKDRCFYTDCSAYSITKNNWRMIETSKQNVKTRKNHAAAIYNKFYIVSGGLDQSQQTINQISWNNLQCKKSSWKGFKIEGRFNHKIITVQPQNGKDFLCIFGGRNHSSQILASMLYVPLSIYDGDLVLKDPVSITHSISAREMPIMVQFMQGFIVFGGINQNSDVVEDSWYYNGEKQIIEEVPLKVSFGDLRGAKGCLFNEKLYILIGNSTKYRAIQIQAQK